jgi:guanylate kinase
MHAGETQSGLLLVMSGPSGVGKTTIARRVEQRFGGTFSVSATTRPQTAEDVEGRDYYFVDEARFETMIEAGAFLEHARVFGQSWYGTPRRPVEERLARGELVILDIDVQGAIQVRAAMPDALLIFILPPSDEELLRRLRDRARDDEAAMNRRFAESKREITTAHESGAYDAFVVNEQLEGAVDRVCRLVEQRLQPAAQK